MSVIRPRLVACAATVEELEHAVRDWFRSDAWRVDRATLTVRHRVTGKRPMHYRIIRQGQMYRLEALPGARP